MKIGKKIKSFASILIIITILFACVPQKSYAYAGVVDLTFDASNFGQNVVTIAKTVVEHVKTWVLDGLAWKLGATALQKLTAQTVNWINGGFNGNPAYVTNPGQFFLDLGDQTVLQFVNSDKTIGQLCLPFQAKVRLALVKNYLNETGPNYSCSFSTFVQNFDSFTRNFDQGGWDSWFNVTQNSQSNPYGTYLNVKNSISVQTTNSGKTKQKELDWGKGFFSWDKCNPDDPSFKPKRVVDQTAEGGGKITYPESCAENAKETVTPGSVIENQLEDHLGSGVAKLKAADAINEVLGALFSAFIGKVMGGVSGGLRSLSGSGSATYGTARNELIKIAGGSGGGTYSGYNTSGSATGELIDDANEINTNPNAPTLTLVGDKRTNVYKGAPYADYGVIAFDVKDGDITDSVQITLNGQPATSQNGRLYDTIDTSVIGATYTITYNVTDSAGISATPQTRTVNVISTPDINQNLTNPIDVNVKNTVNVNCLNNTCSSTNTYTNNPVNGQCGPSNAGTFTSQPATNLCTVGVSSGVSGSGPWFWSCAGTNGGTNASCQANVNGPAINGACSSPPNLATYTTAPTGQLCLTGNASPTSLSGNGPWGWSCLGSNGGGNASCQAYVNTNVVVNGQCATPPNGSILSSAPTGNLCSAGTKTSLTGSGPWFWSCLGSGIGHTDATNCSAATVSTVQCATPPNGSTLSTAPTGTLCVNGSVASPGVTGSGPWNWTCIGPGAFTSVTCSANKALAPTATFTVSVQGNPLYTNVHTIGIPVGTFVTYNWSSTNATQFSSTLTSSCGAGTVGINTASGSTNGSAAASQVPCGQYTLTYTATNAAGVSATDKIFVTVFPSCQLTGIPGTITAGQSINWSVTSNPPALPYFWFVNGPTPANGTPGEGTGLTNFFGSYQVDVPGTYSTYFKIIQNGVTQCTSNIVQTIVN